ncbi:MAG: DUF1465 family protein [Emcibacteraceae bacterium]|nr:DUF1465 family protein [Emcibacteraceae bacterium]
MLEDAISGDGLLKSDILEELYAEAMDLSSSIVEYLQSNKRESMVGLGVETMGFYTLECNRMTTGVMQAMSWCLMQKGVRSGEMTVEEASIKENRLTNNQLFEVPVGCDVAVFPELFANYSTRVRVLYEKIVRIDRLLYEAGVMDENPVHNMLDKLKQNT